MCKLEGKKITGISVALASAPLIFFFLLLIQQFYIVIQSAHPKPTGGSSELEVNNSSSCFGQNKLNYKLKEPLRGEAEFLLLCLCTHEWELWVLVLLLTRLNVYTNTMRQKPQLPLYTKKLLTLMSCSIIFKIFN